MIIKIDPASKAPLHEQIAASVRRAIAEGRAKEGDRLPPARTVAEGLGVNLHTVLRAYQQLANEDVIELRRGRGARVRHAGQPLARLHELAAELLNEAKRQGLSKDEVVALIGGSM